jgi:SAM-dependent methyltransferase
VEELGMTNIQPAFACRSCGGTGGQTVIDLGQQPLANAFVSPSAVDRVDAQHPLHARVCMTCLLVQVDDVVSAEEIFVTYAYFSSYSSSWVEHARRFAHDAIERVGLGIDSQVVEIASNDGYLLKHFIERGIPVRGVDPATNVVEIARQNGVPTECEFFGLDTARRLVEEGHAADLIVANNVLAHVPDLHDFVAGVKTLLKPGGVLAVEFQHVLRLIELCAFDTIYHEHYCYFSLFVVRNILARAGLRVFDVEQLATHGGSLRVWAGHDDDRQHRPQASVDTVHALEADAGLLTLGGYAGFDSRTQKARLALRSFLSNAKKAQQSVVAYGAAAKGNTLLNYCGVDSSLVRFVVDRNPHKQHLSLPGSRLEVRPVEDLVDARPDYVLILPWNLRDEIVDSLPQVAAWGGRFVVPIPTTVVS